MLTEINPIVLMRFDRLRGDLIIERMPHMRELWDRNGGILHPLKSTIDEAIK